MKKELIGYLPPVLKEALEFNLILEAEQGSVDQVLDAAETVLNDQFYDTASLRAIERYESILSLVPRDTDTLDDRRFRIKTFFNAQPAYTTTALIRKLISLCGESGWGYVQSIDQYTLQVFVALTSKNRLSDVEAMMKKMIPANIAWTVGLMYNTYRMLESETHRQLQSRTYEQMRSEVL